MKQNFIEDNIIILSKQTMDAMLNEKNPADSIGLYCFYYYTAKWQKTNIIKCTTNYAMQGLQWSKKKTITTKKILKQIGLIEDEITKNTKGQVVGWYIKLNYVWKKETIKNQRVALPEGGFTQRVAKPATNALSVSSSNALNANKGDKALSPLQKDFNDFWEYFKAQYALKITKDPPILSYPKLYKLGCPILKQVGIEKLKSKLDAYFESNDPFFKKVGWSMEIFFAPTTFNGLK